MFGERAYDHPGHIEAEPHFAGMVETGKDETVERRVPELCWRIEG